MRMSLMSYEHDSILSNGCSFRPVNDQRKIIEDKAVKTLETGTEERKSSSRATVTSSLA